MRQVMQFGFTLACIIVLAVCLFVAQGWNSTTALFPRVIGYPILVLLIVILVMDIVKERRLVQEDKSEQDAAFKKFNLNMIKYFGWLIGFVVLMWLVGIVYTVPVFIFSYMKREGRYTWLASLSSAVAMTVFIVVFFQYLFKVAWPEGVLFTWHEDSTFFALFRLREFFSSLLS